MDPNPFSVLSLIVAPAILTNASSVLVMSTSNRLARAVDRARELSKQLEETTDFTSVEAERRLRELAAAEQRTVLLLNSCGVFMSLWVASLRRRSSPCWEPCPLRSVIWRWCGRWKRRAWGRAWSASARWFSVRCCYCVKHASPCRFFRNAWRWSNRGPSNSPRGGGHIESAI